MKQRCKNPWNPKCRNKDIALDIVYEGERRPICRKCWDLISKSNQEWVGIE